MFVGVLGSGGIRFIFCLLLLLFVIFGSETEKKIMVSRETGQKGLES